jgi:hypothetical protein
MPDCGIVSLIMQAFEDFNDSPWDIIVLTAFGAFAPFSLYPDLAF